MKSYEVPYSEFNYILANCEEDVFDIPTNLTFDFKEYVKSQIHFPLVTRIKHRNLSDYLEVLNALEEKRISDEAIPKYIKVLKFFYQDIGHSILNTKSINNDSDFRFYVHVDTLNVLAKRSVPSGRSDDIANYLIEESRSDSPAALEVS